MHAAPRFADAPRWDAAPLGLDGLEHREAGSPPERRRFNARWLSATSLLGTVAAALMCGALFAAIDRDSRHVSRPISAARFASRRPPADKPRGDRLQPQFGQPTPRELKRELQVEQLAPSGTRMHPFTHVAAKLAAVVAATPDLPPTGPRTAAHATEPDGPPDVSAGAAVKGARERVSDAQAVADQALGAMSGAQASGARTGGVRTGVAHVGGGFARPPTAARAMPQPLPAASGFAPPPAVLAYAPASSSLPQGLMPPEILNGGSSAASARPIADAAPVAGIDTALVVATAPMGEALNVSILPRAAPRSSPPERVLVAKPGDTLEAILLAAGLPAPDATALARALWRAAGDRPAPLAGGEEVMLAEPPPDADTSRPLKVRFLRPGTAPVLLVSTDAGNYVPVQAPPATRPEAAQAAGGEAIDPGALDGVSVRDALYRLADAKVVDEPLVDALVRLAEHDVDLDAPLSPTDSLDLVYGRPDGAGPAAEVEDARPEIAFAALNVEGKSRRYYRFTTPDDGAVDYYDAAGRSVTKLLLRKPFANGRQGDGFGWRVHPILGDRRFHNGVDYVGPAGSPIVAAGAGVVEKIDYESGYGKYVRVRHDGGYETTYAHVAGFPSGLKVGQRVRQGQTIAYVGSTGLSTGPHLYYELKVNGHYADPTRIKLAGGRVLQGDVITAFQRERARMDALAAAALAGEAAP